MDIIFLIAILGVFLYAVGDRLGMVEKMKNTPVDTVPATVIAKRTSTSGGTYGGGASGQQVYGYTDTYCYMTFEFENGDRREFDVDDNVYGLLIEGDKGVLTHQGKKFRGFERQRT